MPLLTTYLPLFASLIADDSSTLSPPFPTTRIISCILEHATSTSLPLQRWSVASCRNVLSLDHESSLHNLTNSGGIMILTSLMQGADDDVKAHAASALQTAAVVSDYSEEVLTNISNSCDFSAVIPPLLKSSSHIVQTTSSLLSALLLPITDVSRKTTSTHPSHTIAINLHTSQVINGLMELLLNPSASTPQTTSVLVCLAGITTANRNSDILPTTNLANECMAMLQSTHVHENKQVRAEAKRQQKRDAIYHPATASAITNNARRFAPHPPPTAPPANSYDVRSQGSEPLCRAFPVTTRLPPSPFCRAHPYSAVHSRLQHIVRTPDCVPRCGYRQPYP